jgi:hypothetical protein
MFDVARGELNVAQSDEAAELSPKVKALRETLDKKTEALLATIRPSSKEGEYEMDAVLKANKALDERLDDIEHTRTQALEAMRQIPTEAERKVALKRLETNFVEMRESAYVEFSKAMERVKADLHAIATRYARKIDACATQNAELRNVLEGLRREHAEKLAQLRLEKAALLLADESDQLPIPAPSKAHVQHLFSYVLLQTAVGNLNTPPKPTKSNPEKPTPQPKQPKPNPTKPAGVPYNKTLVRAQGASAAASLGQMAANAIFGS